MTSKFLKGCLACFCHFWEISIFFVFHITLSVLMLSKWNFAVILSLNDKWVVKRLKFGSYCLINCGETGHDILLEFLVFEWLISGWHHIWSWQGNHIDHPPPYPYPPIVECHIVGQRDVSKERKMMQALQNHAYIMQLAGLGINEMIFNEPS